MKKLLIWWHRRLAQYHEAQRAWHCSQYNELTGATAWHKSYSEWHISQIERLKNG